MGFYDITQNLLNKISKISTQSRNTHSKVTLVAVSKTFSVDIINNYIEEVKNLFPIPVLGENKVQEVLQKKLLLHKHQLHFIGHLQSNKVKALLPHIDYLHSLDSIKLANNLEKELTQSKRQLPVLIQANTSGETNKFGQGWKDTFTLLRHASTLPHLEINGLMTMAPLTEDKTIIRNCFRTLRQWRDKFENELSKPLPQLSMGMSHDYQIALEEGSSMIRIGSGIFGQRSYF